MKLLFAIFTIITTLLSPAPLESIAENVTIYEVFCGDSLCDLNETCSTCSIDCGICIKEIEANVKESVVWVKYDYFSQDINGKYGEHKASGSGVIIDQNENYLFILSNRHVLDCRYTGSCWKIWSENMTIRTQDGATHIVERVGFDPEFLDISYLRVKKSTKKNYTITTFATNAHVGDGVIAAGYPAYKIGGLVEYSSKTGSILAIKELLLPNGRLLHSIESDAFTFYGSSGGGFFNNEGELLGISTWGVNLNKPDASESIAIKISSLVDSNKYITCRENEYITLDGNCKQYYGVTHRLLCFFSDERQTIPLEGRVYYNGDNQGKLVDGCVEMQSNDITTEGKIEFDRDYRNGIVQHQMKYDYPLNQQFTISWFIN